MTAVVFVIPAHGRYAVSRLAFTGIHWTLDELAAHGVDAAALVVADDENLDIATDHGFATLDRPNLPLGKKWNDGAEHACRKLAADFVVMCGSDDWVHPDLILGHLANDHGGARTPVFCTRRSTVVAPDGREAVALTVGYDGGDGVRMIPRRTLEPVGYRPTLDNRDRAIDGGTAVRFRRAAVKVAWTYADPADPLWICDFKSAENVTPYEKIANCEHDPEIVADPLARLAEMYPAELVAAAASLFDPATVAA